ncbi:hypothetical protein D3C80_1896440 [compost metagenome]
MGGRAAAAVCGYAGVAGGVGIAVCGVVLVGGGSLAGAAGVGSIGEWIGDYLYGVASD